MFKLSPLKVWIEKTSMNDILVPICQQFYANFVTGAGEMSIKAIYDLAERIRQSGKPARLFYISDFDPAGKSMPTASRTPSDSETHSKRLSRNNWIQLTNAMNRNS